MHKSQFENELFGVSNPSSRINLFLTYGHNFFTPNPLPTSATHGDFTPDPWPAVVQSSRDDYRQSEEAFEGVQGVDITREFIMMKRWKLNSNYDVVVDRIYTKSNVNILKKLSDKIISKSNRLKRVQRQFKWIQINLES